MATKELQQAPAAGQVRCQCCDGRGFHDMLDGATHLTPDCEPCQGTGLIVPGPFLQRFCPSEPDKCRGCESGMTDDPRDAESCAHCGVLVPYRADEDYVTESNRSGTVFYCSESCRDLAGEERWAD